MERLYRDPVHNIISLSDDQPDDRLLIDLINTPEFQRLRHIKQLGLALYTYQGAEHSRFTHSLGVMHVMTRVLDQLAKRHRIDFEQRVTGRAAAMLHDIGHGPFSHVIEKVLRQNHEKWSVGIIADPETVIHERLVAFDTGLPERVISVIEHRCQPVWPGQLVSSQLDVDRFDYLLRDSLMTGAKYGNYDLEWIMHALEIDQSTGQLFVGANGLYAVEEYLQARFYMFRQVYFHRTLRAAEAVLINILRRAIVLFGMGQLGFVVAGSAVERLLEGARLTTKEYLGFDDHDVMFHIKQWMREGDSILSDLARRFMERRLFKTIDLPENKVERAELVTVARVELERLGFDTEFYLVEDRAGDVPYYNYYRPDGKSKLYIEQRGRLVDIADVSEVVRSLRGYELHRLCFPAEALGAIMLKLGQAKSSI